MYKVTKPFFFLFSRQLRIKEEWEQEQRKLKAVKEEKERIAQEKQQKQVPSCLSPFWPVWSDLYSIRWFVLNTMRVLLINFFFLGGLDETNRKLY